ncbi:MAG TPA: hypothetical protein V6D03_10960, partial [Candidatus Caenarcaniphilales bacterium]
QTAEILINLIAPLGTIRQLPPLFDVDTIKELEQLHSELAAIATSCQQEGSATTLCPQQFILLDWLDQLLGASQL